MTGDQPRPYDAAGDWRQVDPRLIAAAQDWTATRRGSEGPDLTATVYRRSDGRYAVDFTNGWGQRTGHILTEAQLERRARRRDHDPGRTSTPNAGNDA